MRPYLPVGFLLALLAFVALASGRDAAAKPSQVGYGTPTPTPSASPTKTATPGPGATATPTATPGGNGNGNGNGGGGEVTPKVRISLLGGGSVRMGQQVRVRFNTAGKVRIQARVGAKGVGGTSAKFSRRGKKLKRVRFSNIGEPPVKVTFKARGRSADGKKARLVKKSRVIRN